jgi:hypothetical protein
MEKKPKNDDDLADFSLMENGLLFTCESGFMENGKGMMNDLVVFGDRAILGGAMATKMH